MDGVAGQGSRHQLVELVTGFTAEVKKNAPTFRVSSNHQDGDELGYRARPDAFFQELLREARRQVGIRHRVLDLLPIN